MKKHGPRDKAFMAAFAKQLLVAKKKATDGGMTVDDFAHELGVTRAGLHKYEKEKSVPGLDVIERARKFGVEVKYGDLDVPLIKKRARKDVNSSEAQLLLPLAIESLSKGDISVEIGPKRPNGLVLNLNIKFG